MLDFLCKESYDLRDFVALITFLRSPDGCPWDQVQTHESIRRNFLEETYEVCEAIDAGDTAHLKEELGDVLMQVLFHTDIEREAGHFDIDDVADAACKKLIYRHPHVFRRDEPDVPDWDTIKQRERAQTTTAEAMDSVARSLPALWRCEKIQAKAARTGFEWPDADAALDKVAEETQELREAVASGEAAHGVVPFENSHAGDVSAVLDLCYNHPELWVVDVYDLPISQNLLVLPGTQLSQLRTVYSHQQAIAQSETFLKQFRLPATAMANTAMAAKFVAESKDPTKAAIASAETAALYGLEILVPNINTDGDNTTRFIVLSREKPTAGNRFSLLFTVDNKPGKLAEVIQVIGASGFNMESIKSRPMPHVPFEYYFYVELVGDAAAGETAALLRELDRTCRTVRLLGVYTK